MTRCQTSRNIPPDMQVAARARFQYCAGGVWFHGVVRKKTMARANPNNVRLFFLLPWMQKLARQDFLVETRPASTRLGLGFLFFKDARRQISTQRQIHPLRRQRLKRHFLSCEVDAGR